MQSVSHVTFDFCKYDFGLHTWHPLSCINTQTLASTLMMNVVRDLIHIAQSKHLKNLSAEFDIPDGLTDLLTFPCCGTNIIKGYWSAWPSG